MKFALRLLGVGSADAVELGNASAVLERDGRALLLIDCGLEALKRWLGSYRTPPPAIYLTHAHMDHVGGLEQLFYRVYFDLEWRGRVKLYAHAALLPILANPASIVLNTSVNAHIGMPNSSVYGASKAALQSLIRTLSGELIGRGIRLNAVSPGPVSTPLYGKLGFSETDLKTVAESIKGLVPAGRFGTPTEVAKTVVFLASDEAAYMVGSEIMIDGGMGTL